MRALTLTAMLILCLAGCASKPEVQKSERWSAYPGCTESQCRSWQSECSSECINAQETSVTECEAKCNAKMADCQTSCSG